MPEQRDIVLAYTGPPFAGRHTSLAALCGASELPFDWYRTPRDHDVLVRRAVRDQPAVFAMVSGHVEQGPVAPPDREKRRAYARERLRTVDGLVFVVDGQRARAEAVLWHWKQLRADLQQAGAPEDLPIVCQVNKRDLPHWVGLDWAREHLRWRGAAYVPSDASRGEGTLEALDALLAMVRARRLEDETG